MNMKKLSTLLPRKGSFVIMKFFFEIFMFDTQNYVKRPEKWFIKNVRMDVCVYVKTSGNSNF